jgi:hypothetical protein
MISTEIMRLFHASSRRLPMENEEAPCRENLLHFASNALRQKLPGIGRWFAKIKDFFQISSNRPIPNH